MIGTVAQLELLLGSRRNRLRVFRWLYGGWLVAQLLFFYLMFLLNEQAKQFVRMQGSGWQVPLGEPVIPVSAPQAVAGPFSQTFIVQQFILLAIATPALVAGAITDEKRRGTLQHLLLADINTRALLLGKLLGRVAQVGMLALVGLPLFALMAGFGGVQPLTLLALALVVALSVFSVAAAALLASVWCRQTRDAVLALYAVGIAAGLAVWRWGGVLNGFDPLWVLEPAETAGMAELGRRLLLMALCWGSVGGVCLALAVWRVKPAYLRELEGRSTRKAAWYARFRLPVDDDPIHWRERNVEGLAPAAGLRRVPLWLAVATLALASSASSLLILTLALAPGATPADVLSALRRFDYAKLEQLLPGAADGFLVQGIVVMLLGSLVVGIRCSGSVTGERERQTWEPLLLTQLSARELVRSKLWGIMGASYIYLFAYGLPAAVVSLAAGPLAVFWVVLWLGVTVLAMYFVGAAGVWSSVRSKSSWQALLKTLGWGYLFGTFIYTVTSPALWVVMIIVAGILAVIDAQLRTTLFRTFVQNFNTQFNAFFVATCVSLAVIFWLCARFFLNWAQKWIAQRERTRHWQSAPVYRRAKRRVRAARR
jgi:ABC-type transport system involved in multi-copper enzyme maturation permease subunit